MCQRIRRNQAAAKTGGMIRLRLEYKVFQNRSETHFTVRGLLAFFAAIAKTIHKDFLLSNKTGAEATSMGKLHKHTVLARAHYWSKMKHPFDIRAYSTSVDETPHGILEQLTEMLPAKWFIAAFGNQGLKIEQYAYKSLNYNMQDVVGIAKPTTGVQQFQASGWEQSGVTADRVCFEWMKSGCAKGDRCSYKHHENKHQCLRNLHEPERVSNTVKKYYLTTRLIMNTCDRETEPLENTKRRKNGGKEPLGGKQGGNKGGNQEKVGTRQVLGGSETQEGGKKGRQEWYHRQVAHEQLGGRRCGMIEGGN